MHYLDQKYKEMCKVVRAKYGFKSYRKNHYRIVNDVFQSFSFHKSVSGSECTVEFAVLPLCEGNRISKDCCGTDHLKIFEGNYSWFSYDRNDERSMDECMRQIFLYLKKYLIPFFDRSDNSQNAYFETYDFMEKNYKNGVSWFDSGLFYFALKAGMYDKAILHLSAIKKQKEAAFIRNMEVSERSEEYKNRVRLQISELEYKLKMLSKPDLEYINKLICDNENLALSNLGIKA